MAEPEILTRFTGLRIFYDGGRSGKGDGQFFFADAQTIGMADAQVALTLVQAASATQIKSNVLYVDPASAGGTEDLLLPPEADSNGLELLIVNTADGAEDIVVKEDSDSTTIFTLNQNEMGIAVCDGTTWRGATLSSTAEQAFLSGVTAGTVTASKAVVVDANKDIASFRNLDAVKVTGATLVIESLNPLTVKLNDTDALQFDNAAISGFAGAADTAGTDVFIETQDGGADTAVDGAVKGGDLSVKTGDAGAAGADQDGAAGGSITVQAGAGTAGGAHTANNPNGGDGGDITLTVGAAGAAGSGGSGVAGDTGKVKVSGGPFDFANAQVIDMADAQVALTRNPGTPAGTEVVSNALFIDPNSAGGTENLLLPPEADSNGLALFIVNTADGAENIVVRDDGDATTIATISQNEVGWVVCNGTTWRGGIMAQT